ncbi:R3H domain-containing protein 2 [Cucurbita argyrosperma subsp. argyrosperma]|nr:R3H domain-containing protein 2 [Cucurbita argyrosperma subsp. argyrosperma]
MEGSAVEDLGAPESWEVANLDEAMSRLMLPSSSPTKNSKSLDNSLDDAAPASHFSSASFPSLPSSASSTIDRVPEDVVNQVDQFLLEALHNPRERLSILRMEQDVEKFIRDPARQQLEFQQLPTSYLRLAAHRVAQHYSLQSMVLLDNSLPDGSGSKIIVSKTSECRLPAIRLADIPVNLPTEENSTMKVAIKQRPQKRSQVAKDASANSSKTSGSKSVEERKEEYNKARARIFNCSSNSGSHAGVKVDADPRLQDSYRGSLGAAKVEEKMISGVPDTNFSRGLIDCSTSSSRISRSRTDKELPIRQVHKPNSRVAIFRDREIDIKDPDYDRSYDRYMQRFDPGFGFSGGPYTVQPMYAPAVNYNTEFPQLGSAHRQVISECQPRPLPSHVPGPWNAQSSPAGLGYGHREAMVRPFNLNVDAHSSSGVYLHSSQYPGQQSGMHFIHPHEQTYQPFTQQYQQQPDAGFDLARPR